MHFHKFSRGVAGNEYGNELVESGLIQHFKTFETYFYKIDKTIKVVSKQ